MTVWRYSTSRWQSRATTVLTRWRRVPKSKNLESALSSARTKHKHAIWPSLTHVQFVSYKHELPVLDVPLVDEVLITSINCKLKNFASQTINITISLFLVSSLISRLVSIGKGSYYLAPYVFPRVAAPTFLWTGLHLLCTVDGYIQQLQTVVPSIRILIYQDGFTSFF